MPTSLSCSVLRVHKLVPTLAALPLAATLSGCSVTDGVLNVVGPRPNGEVIALAEQASADWQHGDPADAELRELRKAHSDQLVGEARRLCGTGPSGEVPRTCDIDLDAAALPPAESVDQLVTASADAAGRVPGDSVDLVVSQAIDAAALRSVPLAGQGLSLDAATDAQAANHMLDQEYAFQYALGVAEAYADEALRARIGDLLAASSERCASLSAALGSAADLPAAGYEFSQGVRGPVDTQQATELVEQLQQDLVAGWRRVAADAKHTQWRDAAIRLAAQAQRA